MTDISCPGARAGVVLDLVGVELKNCLINFLPAARRVDLEESALRVVARPVGLQDSKPTSNHRDGCSILANTLAARKSRSSTSRTREGVEQRATRRGTGGGEGRQGCGEEETLSLAKPLHFDTKQYLVAVLWGYHGKI